MKTPDTHRPGERLFALLLVVFAGYAFWESYGISGFEGLTTGGVMPMLASGVMVVTSLTILFDVLTSTGSAKNAETGLLTYIFPLPVVFFALLVAGYVAIIPWTGFLPASCLFLFVGIWALWRRGPIWACAISLLSTGLIYLLFRVVFQVVLPSGSLWQ